ncbi:MAG: alpha-L-fucosidase [Clostridia bacterium]|nr:alpha-L-fucosidase [Clostridia bacterium]
MKDYSYVERFSRLGLGLFVHFGLYSRVGKGEWYLKNNKRAKREIYEKNIEKFNIKKNWAKDLVKTAKTLGAKYITLTTRHHDGFSLYDTEGLCDFDAPHSACGRDLVSEFVAACKESGILPVFYHTLLDWRAPEYQNDFGAYIDYLVKSLEILCKNYGEIGGFWFDGMWDKPDGDWQEDRLYGTIRKYQPNAVIINNTGLNELGKLGHIELDGVTFERGTPFTVGGGERPIFGEMCQVLNDHWGFAKGDCNYKSVKELIENLVDARVCGCNLLLNTGLRGDGSVNQTDKAILSELGKWVKANGEFVYGARYCALTAENADVCKGEDCYFVAVKETPMAADINVQRNEELKKITLGFEGKDGVWLDDNSKIKLNKGSFTVKPFEYGKSLSVRIAKFKGE